jgi:hypothetical protein
MGESNMWAQEDRRRARRIQFPQPIQASLSQIPVKLVDLSASGALIHHDTNLTVSQAQSMVLEFEYEGERYCLNCQVSRSRVDNLRTTVDGVVYTSGLHFVGLDDSAVDSLWGLIGQLAVGTLDPSVVLAAFPITFAILSQ